MQRRLRRSREDYWIAGVCGGFGKYFEMDSNPIRLAFVLLAAWNGLGVLLYLVTVLIVPEDPLPDAAQTSDPVPPSRDHADESRRVRMLGWLLLLGGVYLLLRNLHLFGPVVQDQVFPVILILGGLVLLLPRSGPWRS